MITWRNNGAHNGLWYEVTNDQGVVVEVAREESANALVAMLNEMERRVRLFDRCTKDGCGKVLHSIREGKSGVCSSCWFNDMSSEKKGAINKLIGAAFKECTDEEKSKVIDDAFDAMKEDAQ